ncbi:MAG: YeeE/YedE family protein [Gammaproteobacteria bacterium]|nr:YeeE/YedE family protein [Gammaproteobacteria bacterium]
MTFESFVEAHTYLLWASFILAFILGAVVNKTNFCTMGAVSDLVNMGDYSRFRAWLLAIAVAMLGVIIFESAGLMSVDSAFPPYRASQIIWIENILGGLLFGIGMTLASGCGNKTLIRIGAGNLKSILVFIVIGIVAFYMINPFPDSDQTLYSVLFYNWVSPLAIDIDSMSDLGSLVNAEAAVTMRLIIGLVIAALLLFYIFKSADFRSGFDNILAGIVVGLVILAAWYISANISIDADGEAYDLSGYYEEWDMLSDDEEGKPMSGRTLNTQSFTFINPVGQTYGLVISGFNMAALSFGLLAVAGVILGSLFWALISKGFRIEWFANLKDFAMHFIGAILMGIGGTMALGCTIGQGITGISTLALGSFLTFFAILFGSALTMKIQYYKMLYEDASFLAALVTALVELRVLPKSMRKLEAL